jgi:WD40 repeat protein
MSVTDGRFNELARVLERVCRSVNPPHSPRIEPVTSRDLGLSSLGLRSGDPRLAYRYLRGLQLEEPHRPAVEGSSSAAAVWLPAGGPLSPAFSFCEIQPGEFAVGEESGHIRIFQRAPRGRWECAAVIAAHTDAVMDMAALPGGGFVSAGRDRTLRVFDTDKRGMWRETFRSDAHSDTVNAVCVLSGSAIASGGRDNLVQFYAPDGDGSWSASVQFHGVAQVMALEALDEQTVAAAFAGDAFRVLRLGEGLAAVSEVGSLGTASFGSPSDLALSGQRLFACYASGYVTVHPRSAKDSLEMLHPAVGSAQLLGICALDDEHFATWGNDNAVRVWALGTTGRPEQRAQFASPVTGLSRVASLSDGRIVFNETGRIVVAGPDRDGKWRVEEELAKYELPVSAIATQGAHQVVCAWPRLGLMLLDRTKTGNDADWDVTTIDSSVGVSALASIGGRAFASLSDTGAVTAYRPDEKDRWLPEEVAPSGARGVLAFGGEQWLAAGRAGGLIVWRRSGGGKFTRVADLPLDTNEVPSLLAGNDAGLFAIGLGTSGLLVAGPSSDGTWRVQVTINTLASTPTSVWWHSDNLLLIGQARGSIQVVSVTGTTAGVVGEIENQSGAATIAIGSRGGTEIIVVNSAPKISRYEITIRGQQGAVPSVEITPRPSFELHRLFGPLRIAAFGGNSAFIGADALYVIDNVATDNVRVSRVQVTADAVLTQVLDSGGRVRQARTRKRALGDVSSPWAISLSPDETRLPNDSLLHVHAAFVDGGGRLQEVSYQATQVHWENADHTLLLQDPALP